MKRELQIAARAYKRAEEKLEAARAIRDDAIRDAHAEGMSLRAIASHVGIAHQRVAQILEDGGDGNR